MSQSLDFIIFSSYYAPGYCVLPIAKCWILGDVTVAWYGALPVRVNAIGTKVDY